MLQELQAVVPTNPSVPVQPVILAAQEEPGMLDFFRPFPSALKTHCYHTPEHLIDDLDEQLIGPAEAKILELRGAKPAKQPVAKIHGCAAVGLIEPHSSLEPFWAQEALGNCCRPRYFPRV